VFIFGNGSAERRNFNAQMLTDLLFTMQTAIKIHDIYHIQRNADSQPQ